MPWDHKKCTIVQNNMLTNEEGPKITLFALNYGSKDVLTWILFIVCDLKKKYSFMKKWNKIKVELEHWSCLLNKYVVTLETNNH